MIQLIKNLLGFRKEEVKVYPPYGFIDYTEEAKKSNIKDDQNKIIKIWDYNKFGNIEMKKLKYSQAMAKIQENNGIPIIDLTRKEQKFGIITKTSPDEIVYTRRGR